MFSTLHKMFTGKTVSFLSMKTVLAVFMLMIGIGVNATERTVTYNANSGQFTRNFNNKQTFDDGSSTTTYNLPTASNISRSGYTLVGWNTNKNGNGTTVTNETVITSVDEGNHTIYAIWGRNVTVSFDVNNAPGVSKPANKTVVQKLAYGDLPTITRTGYRFDGWYTSANNNGTQVTAETIVTTTNNRQTLYAHWTQLYTITFNANGGECSESSRVVANGEAYGELPVPTRTGYTFTGWYTSATGNTQQTATTTASGNRTLYAHWTVNTYTVTFDVNEGDALDVNTKTVTYASTYGELPTPTREAYVFAGWWTAAEGGTEVTALSTVDITDAQTLYAQWQERKMYIFANKVPNTNRYVTTFYDSKYAYTIPENVTAYTAVQNGNMFDLTPIEGTVIAKGEGVVLVTTKYDGEYTLAATAEPAEKIAENQLIGVDEDTQVDGLSYSDIFILSYTSQYGLGFYLLTGPSLVANKAFFGTPSASAAKNFGFRFLDRGTTGINSVATETTGIRKIAGANGIVIEKDGKQYNVAGGRIK